MTPFHELKQTPPRRAIGVRGTFSLWEVDTVLARLYDLAVAHRLVFRQPAIGIRHGAPGVPDPFASDYEVLFPLPGEAQAIAPPGTALREIPGGTVASFFHRGPYEWIPCTYEKVLDWLRENGYEVAGEVREIFFVAPDPHSGGTQDDMLTEIEVPVRARVAGSAGSSLREAA